MSMMIGLTSRCVHDRERSSRDWVRDLCGIATVWRDARQVSIRGLFEAADPDLSDRSSFERAVRTELDRSPELVDAWLGFVEDYRGTPAPYFQANWDSLKIVKDSVMPLPVGQR